MGKTVNYEKKNDFTSGDIVRINRINNFVELYIEDGTVYRKKQSLKSIYETLNPEKFVYVDRGIIVNVEKIAMLDREKVEMTDGTVIYIARDRKKEVRQRFKKFLINS